MRQVVRICGLAMLLCLVTKPVVTKAQAPAAPAAPVASGPAAEVQRSYAAAKKNILKSADEMPAENYQYKPEPDIRTYARVLTHIAEAQFRRCGVAHGV